MIEDVKSYLVESSRFSRINVVDYVFFRINFGVRVSLGLHFYSQGPKTAQRGLVLPLHDFYIYMEKIVHLPEIHKNSQA